MPTDQPESKAASPEAGWGSSPERAGDYAAAENFRSSEPVKDASAGEVERLRGEFSATGTAAPARLGSTDDSYARFKRIEKVLEEDLGEIYNNLTPQEQKEFKSKGEQTARAIFLLVYGKAKVKVKKIVKLIKVWLKAVPGINRFFLEQEAKIKADKIVAEAAGRKVEF